MGLDVAAAVNSAADWISSSPVTSRVLRSPFLAALLVVALAAIILIAVHGRALQPEGGKKRARALIYLYLGTLMVLFAHYAIVGRLLSMTATQARAQGMFANLGREHSPGAWAVTPQILGAAEVSAAYEERDTRPPYSGRPDNVEPGGAGAGPRAAAGGADEFELCEAPVVPVRPARQNLAARYTAGKSA